MGDGGGIKVPLPRSNFAPNSTSQLHSPPPPKKKNSSPIFGFVTPSFSDPNLIFPVRKKKKANPSSILRVQASPLWVGEKTIVNHNAYVGRAIKLYG